ncbi:MAG: transcription elongation factor GreA [SAR324 cluster bacterium]|nr:transcription elongation factor GreA [SAR324 cluster bacterium]
MTDRIPITKAGLVKIKEELHHLISVQRPAVQRAIAEAREHGDLRENAEYHAAKERQSFIEGRIQEINAKFPKFQAVDPAQQTTESVVFGATVTLENVESGDVLTYQIVGPDEADIKQNRISVQSPIARALIGRSVGDVVAVTIPRGQIEVEITDVAYA